MHSIAEIGTNVPAFLGKLWKMVEDPVTNDLISWNSTGTSFVIKDEIRFARELLPMYYKHNNMASFIRQLNMYGFHKIVSPDAGSMKLETPDEIKFTHPFFMRGHPYLLDNIKRKIGVSKVVLGQLGEKTPQVINKVLSDVRQMKGRQENLDSRLTAMKLENGALWRELSLLRQKHMKQQQIVNKLIQFLVTIVQQNHNNFSVKRKYPRMLQHHEKMGKEEQVNDAVDEVNSNTSGSPTGPVIHELDPAEALLETVVEEAEANTLSDASVSEYFLNPTDNKTIDGMAVNAEMPEEVAIYKINDANAETIIGIPEDSLVPPHVDNLPQKNGVNVSADTRTTNLLYPPTKRLKKPTDESVRPKYVKLITKRPKKGEENQQRIHLERASAADARNQMERTLQQQLQINQDQLDINKQQIIKNEQQNLQSQQNQLSKKQQLPKNGHILSKNKLLQKNQQQQPNKCANQRLLKNNQKTLQGNTQQSMDKEQQGILLQRLQQTAQSPKTSEPIITIPFDNGTSENIITEVNTAGVDLNPLYMDGSADAFSLPVVVEVPQTSTSPTQVSPSPPAMSPQDLLLGSPVMINDPVMTPQCEPAITPIISSPEHSGDMQVACVDESQVTSPSPNIVTRSAPNHHLFTHDCTVSTRAEMGSHIDSVQNDLDNLKEFLKSEGITLDASTLLGYFNDDPMSYNMSDSMNGEEPKDSSGSELMTCNPPLFDFTDLMGSDWSLPTSPDENLPAEDSFAEVNTPQFVPQSPSFTAPTTKKRKK